MFRLLQLYKSVVHGVGFIPLLTTLILIILALFLTLSPAVQSLNSFVYSGGYFEVRTAETARAVLTSIFAGILSLCVFSFSMMIVVVNQAASNYSPKVVATLSSGRSNQYILGVNLGTIIFALIVMMHVDNQKADGGIPELAIFVNVVLATYCLLLFVRFINNISNSVRINNIIKTIYRKTKSSAKESLQQDQNQIELTERENWIVCRAKHSGYFQLLRFKPLLKILKQEDAIVNVFPMRGSYYLQNEPLFSVNKKLDENSLNSIRTNFITYHGEVISDNAVYGFRQLREIAVKALSPGINDPGVAILCIEHLSELLALHINRRSFNWISDENGEPRILVHDFDFKSLVELSLVPVKTYGKRDQNVLSSLLWTAYQLSLYDEKKAARSVLQGFALSVVADADENISSKIERELLNHRISKLNDTRYFDLSLLPTATVAHPG